MQYCYKLLNYQLDSFFMLAKIIDNVNSAQLYNLSISFVLYKTISHVLFYPSFSKRHLAKLKSMNYMTNITKFTAFRSNSGTGKWDYNTGTWEYCRHKYYYLPIGKILPDQNSWTNTWFNANHSLGVKIIKRINSNAHVCSRRKKCCVSNLSS